jgi:hypothetical protein
MQRRRDSAPFPGTACPCKPCFRHLRRPQNQTRRPSTRPPPRKIRRRRPASHLLPHPQHRRLRSPTRPCLPWRDCPRLPPRHPMRRHLHPMIRRPPIHPRLPQRPSSRRSSCLRWLRHLRQSPSSSSSSSSRKRTTSSSSTPSSRPPDRRLRRAYRDRTPSTPKARRGPLEGKRRSNGFARYPSSQKNRDFQRTTLNFAARLRARRRSSRARALVGR